MQKLFFYFILFICSSCGWHLAGSKGEISAATIKAIRLLPHAQDREMTITFEQTLKTLKIDNLSTATTILHIDKIEYEKRPTAYTNSGIPAQFQLIYMLNYRIQTDNKFASKTITARRFLDFETTAVIAKENEERELREEMREEIAERVIATIQ